MAITANTKLETLYLGQTVSSLILETNENNLYLQNLIGNVQTDLATLETTVENTYATKTSLSTSIADLQGAINDVATNLAENYVTNGDLTVELNDYYTKTESDASYATAWDLEAVRLIAEGRAKAVSFDTIAAMMQSLTSAKQSDYKVGDNIFIKDINVPDYWVSKVFTSKQPTTIDTNTANNIKTGTIGYFELSVLETQKVDLSTYYTKTQTDNLFTALESSIASTYLSKAEAANTYATETSVDSRIASLTTDIQDGTIIAGQARKAVNDSDGNKIVDTYATKETVTQLREDVTEAINSAAVYTKMVKLPNVGTSYTETKANLQLYVPVAVFNSNWQMLVVDIGMGTNGFFTINSDKPLGTIYVLLNYFNIDDIA